MFRVGLGKDSHKIKFKIKNEKLKISRLGGVEIKDWEIIANSDGDVIIHALCNALSSAIGGDSLGTWADEMFEKGITDSRKFLKIILARIKEKGLRVNNIAVCVEAKKPRLTRKQIQKIRTSLANLLDIAETVVGLTFTSDNGITPFGQGKAVQALVLASLLKDDN